MHHIRISLFIKNSSSANIFLKLRKNYFGNSCLVINIQMNSDVWSFPFMGVNQSFEIKYTKIFIANYKPLCYFSKYFGK